MTLVVRDYDEALAFFTTALRFTVLEDTPLGEGQRWVRVAPARSGGAALLLARAATPEQLARVGDQTGGGNGLGRATAVRFAEEPRHEPYGWVVVFLDLYSNRWDLIQPAGAGMIERRPAGEAL